MFADSRLLLSRAQSRSSFGVCITHENTAHFSDSGHTNTPICSWQTSPEYPWRPLLTTTPTPTHHGYQKVSKEDRSHIRANRKGHTFNCLSYESIIDSETLLKTENQRHRENSMLHLLCYHFQLSNHLNNGTENFPGKIFRRPALHNTKQ